MRNPLHYGVAVGINVYPAIGRLAHARRDARAFGRWLRDADGGGLPKANVKVIAVTDRSMRGKQRANAKPIAKQVFEAIDQFRLDVDAKIDNDPELFHQTRLYLFVSGHGIAPQAGDAALLMADAGSNDYQDNNVSCRELIDYFELRQYFRELVVFADCCRTIPGGGATPGRPPWNRTPRNYGGVLKVWGWATEFADVALEPSSGGGTSGASDDGRHGHFTKALLEGLGGAAVDEATREINAMALRAFVKRRVEELTGGRQKSKIVDPDPVVFRAGVTARKHRVKIAFPAGYTSKVVLEDGAHEALDRHEANAKPWVVELPDGLYRVRPERRGASASPFHNGGIFDVEGRDLDVQL